MQLSAIAKEENCETSLTSIKDNYLRDIKNLKPDLIAASIMSPDFQQMNAAIKKIKEDFKDIPIIAGGPHPTFFPEIINESPLDAICVGEGDIAFRNVLNYIKKGVRDFTGINNIITRNGKAPLNPLVDNIDSLPFMDREVLYDSFPVFKHFQFRGFNSSRGCPYNCSYCFNHSYNKIYRNKGKIVRKRSVDNLLTEIEIVTKKYPTRFIKFSDDSFIHGADDWLVEFSSKYRKKINLPFYCLIRADRVNEKVVALLKEAGCHSVCMSIENGNENIRKNILNRNVSDAQIIRAFVLFRKAGVNTLTSVLIGVPGMDCKTEVDKALELLAKCSPTTHGFNICVPFYGTDLFRYCKNNNLVENENKLKYEAPSFNELSILNSYTYKEKIFQRNIYSLGPFAVYFPFLKKTILKIASICPNYAVFNLLSIMFQLYYTRKHIIPIKTSMKEKFFLLKNILKYYLRR